MNNKWKSSLRQSLVLQGKRQNSGDSLPGLSPVFFCASFRQRDNFITILCAQKGSTLGRLALGTAFSEINGRLILCRLQWQGYGKQCIWYLLDKLTEKALLLALLLDNIVGINRLEGFLEVYENIIDMLCTDRESDCVRLDALLKQLFGRKL